MLEQHLRLAVHLVHPRSRSRSVTINARRENNGICDLRIRVIEKRSDLRGVIGRSSSLFLSLSLSLFSFCGQRGLARASYANTRGTSPRFERTHFVMEFHPTREGERNTFANSLIRAWRASRTWRTLAREFVEDRTALNRHYLHAHDDSVG